MEAAKSYNLLDVDDLVSSFIKEYESGIATLHKIHYKTNDNLSLRAMIAGVENDLKTGCVSFINKSSPMDELGSYLFYIVNEFCKKNANIASKKKTQYLCPGCLYFGKNTIINYSQLFKCYECDKELKSTSDAKKILLFHTFYRHNKAGYHCKDCDRFIPHPLDNSKTVSCPYFDCYFVGESDVLKKMHHPTANIDKLDLDVAIVNQNTSIKDNLISDDIGALSKLELKDELCEKMNTLKDVIESQSNSILYNSSDFTVKHKLFTYQAISNLIDLYPEDMVEYLLNNSRSGGFQHKIFQEYVGLLEAAIPFFIKKNGKLHKIDSLLDDNLCIFDGISTFEALVNENFEVKNNTQEFYIGGRKASYAKPFYIGKLLSVINKKNRHSLINNVVEYSFSKIKLKDIKVGTKVEVTHLRIPPHYQMGGMVYVNRIRKKIVDRALVILNRGA